MRVNKLFKNHYTRLLLVLFTLASMMSFTIVKTVKASEASCKEFNKLSTQQVQVLKKSYQYGLQDDLGYTLAAIAFKESSAGRYRVHYKSDDYGSYGINIETIQRLSKTDNYYKTIQLIQEVINDDYIGAGYALTTLRWNLKHHKGDWAKAIMHYNAGNSWWLGREYYKGMAITVRMMRSCLKV